ncbi:MAG: RDD family protein [Acidobacteria bacterium]|nr:RDD family protein [Acidobacteriota bacterium]
MSGPPQSPPPIPDDTTAQYSGYVGATRASTIPDGVGFWPRAGARIIDSIVHTVAALVTGLVLGVMAAVATAAAGGNLDALTAKLDQSSPFDYVVGFLGFLAYHTICEGLHGSSAGKMLLGQVVVTDQVQPCGMRAAFLRNLAYVVDALFFGAIGYMEMQKTRLEKRHGDNWAGTFVARRSQVPISTLRGTGRFIGVLVLALAVDSAILMLYFVIKMG